MPTQLKIGQLDEATHLVSDLALPILETEAFSWIQDAVQEAAVQRKGVAILGDKGAGKSFALRRALEAFEDGEREKAEDASYTRQSVVLVQSPRAKKPTDVIAYLWNAAFGEPMIQYQGRRTKSADQMLQEFVEACLVQHIVVLAFDEAENLSDEALTVLRDLMSQAEVRDAQRISKDSYRASGIGIVLVGTDVLEPRLRQSSEAGRRWFRITRTAGLMPDQAPAVYRRFLPAFDRHAEEVGEGTWAEYVRQKVTLGQPTTIGRIAVHVRSYAFRARNEHPEVERVEDLPFNAELFEYTSASMLRREG